MCRASCLFVLFCVLGVSPSHAQYRFEELQLTPVSNRGAEQEVLPATTPSYTAAAPSYAPSDAPIASPIAAPAVAPIATPQLSDEPRVAPGNIYPAEWLAMHDSSYTDPASIDLNIPPPPARRKRNANTAAGSSAYAAVTGRSSYAGVYVQVSAQKSEAEAKEVLRSLQAKFSSILGSQQSTVRRADLGSKGIYYRAQVGPYRTAQADQICNSLKAAGGECFLQHD